MCSIRLNLRGSFCWRQKIRESVVAYFIQSADVPSKRWNRPLYDSFQPANIRSNGKHLPSASFQPMEVLRGKHPTPFQKKVRTGGCVSL